MKELALSAFRLPPLRLNCAQAVLYAYQQTTGKKEIDLEQMKAFGGGRAPGGLCGALYAACTAAPEKTLILRSRFSERNGSLFCEELRGGRCSCSDCVAAAAELLQAELGLKGDGKKLINP